MYPDRVPRVLIPRPPHLRPQNLLPRTQTESCLPPTGSPTANTRLGRSPLRAHVVRVYCVNSPWDTRAARPMNCCHHDMCGASHRWGGLLWELGCHSGMGTYPCPSSQNRVCGLGDGAGAEGSGRAGLTHTHTHTHTLANAEGAQGRREPAGTVGGAAEDPGSMQGTERQRPWDQISVLLGEGPACPSPRAAPGLTQAVQVGPGLQCHVGSWLGWWGLQRQQPSLSHGQTLLETNRLRLWSRREALGLCPPPPPSRGRPPPSDPGDAGPVKMALPRSCVHCRDRSRTGTGPGRGRASSATPAKGTGCSLLSIPRSGTPLAVTSGASLEGMWPGFPERGAGSLCPG